MKKYLIEKLKALRQLFVSNSTLTIRRQQTIIYSLQRYVFLLEAKLKGFDIDEENKQIKTNRPLDLKSHRDIQDLFDSAYSLCLPTPTQRFTDENIKVANGWTWYCC